MRTKSRLLVTVLLGSLVTTQAMADMAVGVRAGTFGIGADLDIGLTETFTLRLGYNTFSYDHTLEDTDVTYDGTLKVGAASAIMDWHVFQGGFRLSAGAVQKGPSIDVTGTPNAAGSYVIDGTTYTAAQIGTLSGTIKIGNSVAPYVGLGWGNTVDADDRVTFLLDIGAINTGTPEVALNASACPAGVTTTQCTQLRSSINAEIDNLKQDSEDFQWYPVVSLGLAVRF